MEAGMEQTAKEKVIAAHPQARAQYDHAMREIGWRICVGWIAIDYLFTELDVTFRRLLNDIQKLEGQRAK